jgi:hypothetical protein
MNVLLGVYSNFNPFVNPLFYIFQYWNNDNDLRTKQVIAFSFGAALGSIYLLTNKKENSVVILGV